MRRAILAVVAVMAALLVPAAEPAAAASGRVYTYEVRGKGNSSSLSTFVTQAAQTLRDPKGWSLGGNIVFKRVSSGADFTLWLAKASTVPSFGSPCDSTYSCRSGRNVVINESRWLHATPSWNHAGGSLRDYRHMVINHEVGHWLGFAHAHCTGPGNLAPVMQQQSISLQGCRFNPWPTAGERTTLSRRKGVPINHTPYGALAAPSRTSSGVVLAGWAIDPDTIRRPVVRAYVDGRYVTGARAKLNRPAFAKLYPRWGPLHGFRLVVPLPPTGHHQVCVRVINLPDTSGAHARLLGCVTA